MKVLINTPLITIPAGVANHYLGLKKYFSKNVIYNQYLPGSYIHKRVKVKFISSVIVLFFKLIDILKFLVLIIICYRPTVLLNPSFGKTALKRDAIFLRIAKFLGCKVAVFIHGWDKIYLEKVLKKEEKFNRIWYNADVFFVLASEFKNYLQKLNIEVPIYLTTTKVSDQLVERFSHRKIEEITTILFLARIEKEKGIFTCIDSFEVLNRKHPNLKLQIVGGGKALEEAKKYVLTTKLPNVYFTGPLSGERLKNEFVSADLYILPTTHGEGMPTTVLEAMAFGLPVITRPVGGLVDFFENGKMGYLIESHNPQDYADKIELLIKDIEKTNMISQNNSMYARKHFLASKVALKLESILKSL